MPPFSLVIMCLVSSARLRLSVPVHFSFSGKQRWKHLIIAEETLLAGLASDSSRQQSEMAKMAMEIRGLRVPLIEPQPPSVSCNEAPVYVLHLLFRRLRIYRLVSTALLS